MTVREFVRVLGRTLALFAAAVFLLAVSAAGTALVVLALSVVL